MRTLPPLRTYLPARSGHRAHGRPASRRRLAFVGEARIAGDDKQPADRDSAVMISSTMPSAKYSCSGSPLILAKGSTAIDGLSGKAAQGCARMDPTGGGSRR